jgi:UDP-2-acetamido-3-amino-2,3-dideoxy-glucuronate N-acetyltransferase
MVGVPAKRIGWACRCGHTLKSSGGKVQCQACGNEYKEESSNKLVPVKEVQGK